MRRLLILFAESKAFSLLRWPSGARETGQGARPTMDLRAWQRWCVVLLGVVGLGLAGCGSDVAVPGPAPLGGADVAATADATAPPGPRDQPTCFVDADCADLVTSACQVAFCEPSARRCLLRHKLDGAACDDGEPCSAESACAAGSCVASTPLGCNDANPCTTDTCTSGVGCVYAPSSGSACSDGSPCTQGDVCAAGVCSPGKQVCPCSSDADCASLVGTSCVSQLRCEAGACAPVLDSAATCDDGNACTADGCDPTSGSCTHVPLPNGVTCVDGNACTAADHCKDGSCSGPPVDCQDPGGCQTACDPAAGCTVTDEGPCDDANPCTTDDRCTGSGCSGAQDAAVDGCACATAADCSGPLPACAGGWRCTAGVCAVDVALAVPCALDAADPCREAICTPAGCNIRTLPDGTGCDDGTACSTGTTCQQGNCAGGWAVPCDDGNPCSVDSCTASGCQHVPALDGSTCDDGTACVSDQRCITGSCSGGTTKCDDGGPCTTDVCQLGACGYFALPAGTPCEDSDLCTQGGECTTQGSCAPVLLLDCNDNNPCTIDSCGGEGCVYLPLDPSQTVTCNDGNTCTSNDACAGSTCVGQLDATVCACQNNSDCLAKDDGDPCTGVLICQDAQCVLDPASVPVCPAADGPCFSVGCQAGTGDCVATPVAAGTLCSDGNACTVGDACAAGGWCAPGSPVASCADDNPCNAEACDPAAGCVATALSGVPCDDGDLCTGVDTCQDGSCVSGAFVCQCAVDADCAALDDGNACNGGLRCDEGACVADGQSVTCPAGSSACTENICDPATGACIAVARPDGLACAATGQCTSGGSCISGQCVGATVVSCDDGNACTADACDPTTGSCQNTPTSGPCAGASACQTGICTAATCQQQSLVCNDNKACTTDSCDPTQGGCVFAGIASLTEDFETDAPTGWQYLTGSGSNFWQRDPAVSRTGSSALFCGDFATDTGNPFYSGPGAATASVTFAVPATATVARISLWTWVRRDAAEPDGGCGDRLVINATGTAPANLASICARQADWTAVSAEIAVQPGGTLVLGLQWIANDVLNDGEGVWVDDLRIDWDCVATP